MQTTSDISTLITTILAPKLSLDPADIPTDATLESLGADSLTLVDLALDLEKQLPVSIPEGILDTTQTIAEAAAEVQELVTT